jgi:hypothetical protein
MSEISKLLKDSQNPQQRLMAETRGLVSKWEKTGLLEGIGTDTEKSGMAVLLENQAKQLIDEASRTGTSANSEEWSGVALPLVRRVFAEIAAKEFVSVQPMNLPSGLIFYLDFKYGTNQSAQQSGGSLFGGTGSTKSTDAASGGLYGSGAHGYSLNDKTAAANIQGGKATIPADADTDGWAAFTVVDSGGTVHAITASDGTTAAADGNIHYHAAPTDITRGDFEASADTTADANSADGGVVTGSQDVGIPEVNLELKSEPIVAKTRKLKAVWTPELAQDLNAYHSVDAEAELTSLLSEYVSMEIDLEILDMLLANAGTVDATPFDATATLIGGETQGTLFQKLGTKIQKMSNTIHQLTLRGGANFLVCSPSVATVLESIPGYAADTDGNQSQFAMGVTKVGALNNRFQVYKNPYMTSGDVLVGFRGANFLETGAVYAPYVPLIQTPLVYDPVNFTPRRGVMTRYAKKMVRPEFYGKLSVTGTDNL